MISPICWGEKIRVGTSDPAWAEEALILVSSPFYGTVCHSGNSKREKSTAGPRGTLRPFRLLRSLPVRSVERPVCTPLCSIPVRYCGTAVSHHRPRYSEALSRAQAHTCCMRHFDFPDDSSLDLETFIGFALSKRRVLAYVPRGLMHQRRRRWQGKSNRR